MSNSNVVGVRREGCSYVRLVRARVRAYVRVCVCACMWVCKNACQGKLTECQFADDGALSLSRSGAERVALKYQQTSSDFWVDC